MFLSTNGCGKQLRCHKGELTLDQFVFDPFQIYDKTWTVSVWAGGCRDEGYVCCDLKEGLNLERINRKTNKKKSPAAAASCSGVSA